MYSMVLATMLTTGAATPTWGGGWYSCHGCHGCHGCYGCYGCCGGCYGCCGGCYGCYGCCGGCYGCYGCCGGCYGCYGCYGCWGSVVYYVPTAAPAKAEEKKKEVSSVTSMPAKVLVQLPTDATLYINGQKSTLTTTTRTIVTPALPTGENYYYTMRTEVVRDGKVLTESKRVSLQAGEVSQVDFRGLVADETKAKPATRVATTMSH